jgi:thymidylate synthase ThyX
MTDEFYIPELDRLQSQSSINKQGSGEELDEGLAEWARAEMELSFQRARIIYEQLLKAGVAREVARVVIPVAQYSRMRASANLRNWLALLWSLSLKQSVRFSLQCNLLLLSLFRRLKETQEVCHAKRQRTLNTATCSTLLAENGVTASQYGCRRLNANTDSTAKLQSCIFDRCFVCNLAAFFDQV